MKSKNINILGIGNILFADEGVGVRVIEKLQERYTFPKNVGVVDGGTLGLGLLGLISETDHLIVVDAVRKKGEPGTLYRLDGDEVPKRILAKNSLHQVDFLETLASSQALDKVPETVIVGVEPSDIESMSIELTPVVEAKVEALMDMVLKELDRLGISYDYRGDEKHVSGYTRQDH